MNNLALLKSLTVKETYLKYAPILRSIDNAEPEFKKLLRSLGGYFDKYDRDVVNLNEWQLFFHMEYPHLPPQQQESIALIYRELRDYEISNEELLREYLQKFVETHVATKMQNTLTEYLMGGDSRTVMEDIEGYMEEYNVLMERTEEQDPNVCNLSLAELLEVTKPSNVKWRLSILQEALGNLKPKSLGHIFALSETGKTALAVSEITHMAFQLRNSNRKLLYLANEEAIEVTKVRMYSSLLEMDCRQIEKARGNAELMEKIHQKWVRLGGDHIVAVGNCSTFTAFDTYLKKYKPFAVIVDQGTKIMRPGDGKRTGPERLQGLFNMYRNLAIKYDTIIVTVGQADAASENRAYLSLRNMDSSKVGIPGELDFAIGIGMVAKQGEEDIRYINICKNKLRGIHAHGKVLFQRYLNRYV